MANRLQLKRGSGAPGSIFYEGEPIFDKTGKVLFVGDANGAGSGAGTSIASGVAYATVLEMLTQAGTTAGAIKFLEKTSNGNHYIGLAAPDSVSNNVTFKLPDGDGSANQVLKTDGSGNLGFATVSSSFTLSDGSNTDTFNTGDTLTFSGTSNEIETTVSDDQVTFGLPNTVTVTHGLNINSSLKLSISETTIQQGTGDLTIQTNGGEDFSGDDIIIKAHDDVEIQVAAGTTAIYATGGGSVKLNNNGSTKFETSATGATLTGTLTADGISVGDSETIALGQGSDLRISHDGTDNHITSFDKDLNIELSPDGSNPKIYIRPTQSTQGITLGGGSGNPVELYYSNNKKFETTNLGATLIGTLTADGISVGDNENISLGNGGELTLHNDGTDSHIRSSFDEDLNIELSPDGGTPKIYIRPTTTTQGITLGGGSGNPVELYYDNAKKFETTGGGASVTGDLYVSGNLNVVGTAVTFSTETVKVEDRFMELGLVDGAEPTSGNTTWDLGVLFNYNTGQGDGTPKKSGIVWLDNSFLAAVGVATETTGVGNTMPQLNITSYADFIAKDLYLGGTSSTNLVINSSGNAQNLVFDGGSY